MKTDPRRFAPLGLVLAGLAVVSFVVLLIIKGLDSAAVLTLPDPKLVDQGIWISVAMFVLGLALTAFLDPEGARKFFVGRQAQYGSNSLIMLAAFLGILFFANLMAYQYNKDNPPFDVTEDQQNSLAPETINILKALPQPVSAHAYYSSQFPTDEVQKLLENFERNSDDKFSYDFRDLVQDPFTAQQDGVTHDGTIVLVMGERKEIVTQTNEQGLDTALIKLTNPEEHILYFLTGHGERNTEQPSDVSFSQIKGALQNKNYTVKLLNLGGNVDVPADAEVVIIAGPQKPLTASEVALLEAYMEKGGGLIVMEDPRELTEFGDAPDPLADMVAKWGITLEDDLIIDPNVTNSLYTLADPQNYGRSPISEKLGGFNIAFFTARPLKLSETPPEGVFVIALAQTLPTAWSESDFQSLTDKTLTFDPDTDVAGPLVLAASADKNATGSPRLVVFGDSDFATDANFQEGFGDILLNAVDWAAEQENLISLTPKESVARTYEPPTPIGLIGILLLSICFIPLLVVIAGVASWYSRRRRG